jgi:hypothetical protein
MVRPPSSGCWLLVAEKLPGIEDAYNAVDLRRREMSQHGAACTNMA